MDAMQKRRIWKVAVTHFVASVIVSFTFLYLGSTAFTFSGDSIQRIQAQTQHSINHLWFDFCLPAWYFLQPQFLFLIKCKSAIQQLNLPAWIGFAVIVISIPTWSIFFGWILVKLDNWLNHFPVLGKKVF
jgi:hypothetical protein